jgi:hypothetical protein
MYRDAPINRTSKRRKHVIENITLSAWLSQREAQHKNQWDMDAIGTLQRLPPPSTDGRFHS